MITRTKKSNVQEKVFTAITFQGITVSILHINAESKEQAESKLIKIFKNLETNKALKIDDIIKHQRDWSFAVVDTDRIESI